METFVPGNNEKGSGLHPLRVINLKQGIAIVAGSMLGIGIFLFPPLVAASAGSMGWFILLWILGVIYAFSGSVACGELGAMMPMAGGDYIFQRAAFGSSVAFASGWVLFVAIFGGSVAGLSVALFQYQVSNLFGVPLSGHIFSAMPFTWAHLGAITLIVILTFLNHLGTRISTLFQMGFTLVAVLLMLSPVRKIFTQPVMEGTPFTLEWLPPSFWGLISGFLFVNFAFSGWLNIIYVAGEVNQPEKNIPRSMVVSVFGVGLLYVLLCVAFVWVLGFEGLAAHTHTDAGTAMAEELGNPILKTVVLVAVSMAIVTSLNATILTSARVAYAMALDGAFWKGAARLGGPQLTPRHALWVQAALASLLVLTGSFTAIIQMTSIAMLLTGTLTVLSLFVLRIKKRGAARPYRALGYPWFPAVFIVLSGVVLVGLVVQSFKSNDVHRFFPFIGLLVMFLAFFGHFIYKKFR